MDTNLYLDDFSKLIEMKNSISHLHPLLKKLYPIVIVKGDDLLIFDVQPDEGEYRLVKETSNSENFELGIRASLPLGEYNNKSVCVVSEEVFGDQNGYIVIFHEFAHCYQSETCENKIKQNLGIYSQSIKENKYSWELDFNFPYINKNFISLYGSLIDSIRNNKFTEVSEIRKQLKAELNNVEYEYMVWEEWKEGFARFIENKIRRYFKITENKSGAKEPYDRRVFYHGGELYIKSILALQPELETDLEKMFEAMFGT